MPRDRSEMPPSHSDRAQQVALLYPSYGLRVDIIDVGQRRHTSMNRRKKIKQLLEAHAKKANAKLAPKSNKPKYVSKADRAKLEAEATSEPVTSAE